MINALIEQTKKLPAELHKPLTWDRGHEMSSRQKFTLATDIQIYFCNLQSLWQRGSNENTNRLLRDYFLKGTDLSVHSQKEMDNIARESNSRYEKHWSLIPLQSDLMSVLQRAIKSSDNTGPCIKQLGIVRIKHLRYPKS